MQGGAEAGRRQEERSEVRGGTKGMPGTRRVPGNVRSLKSGLAKEVDKRRRRRRKKKKTANRGTR
jgi:hypothetical protein